jgi:acetyl-CoA carboxylase biotin carboxyl carrier protein
VDSKDIRELIELISRSNFKTFELEREGFRLKLVKEEGGPTVSGAPQPTVEPPATTVPQSSTAAALPTAAEGGNGQSGVDGLQELHSPIVGTFYAAPSPGAPNFVEVGSQVAKGQVLCIVEAMKVMNEIECEIDAEVVEILVTNGQPVEYGEVLFRLRPMN